LVTAARLKNVLARQYLDVKWDHIRRFLTHDVEAVYGLLKAAESWTAEPG
jgi:uncharacterized protein YutE (UPF0331/DUF86 family)